MLRFPPALWLLGLALGVSHLTRVPTPKPAAPSAAASVRSRGPGSRAAALPADLPLVMPASAAADPKLEEVLRE
jgi:hypothetical protein